MKYNISRFFLFIYKNNSCGGYNLFSLKSLLVVFFLTTFYSCHKHSGTYSEAVRRANDSIVKAVGDADSLPLLAKQFEEEGNNLGYVVAMREYGKRLRNNSLFDEALRVHSDGLKMAEADADTLEWVQALNNIGTDYRRLGVLDAAQEYHYRAWKLSEEHSDTVFMAKKNRVISLNGLANIYMSLGNYVRADSMLRLALAGEKLLKSELGMAINYANLGSIFEKRGMIDSAWIYYRESMNMNQKAKSNLGISLCHTSFGSLYEKEKQYDKATKEYEMAYELMKASKDEWHAINSLIALAGIHYATNDFNATLDYLDKAKEVAERIKSNEHLAEIYDLYYKYYKKCGDYRLALECHEKSAALQDSVVDMDKINRIQNTSLFIERGLQKQRMDDFNRKLMNERNSNRIGYAALLIAVLLLGGGIATLLYIQRIRMRSHQALQKMSSMRQTFYTNITHEFRTPLTVILGLSENIEERNELPADVRDTANIIKRQGKSLLVLINQLLDISKIKSAVGNPDWYSGNIIAYLEMIVETYRNYAHSRNVDLQLVERGPVKMDFVPDYVNKVLNNLLSNALKFTPEYGKISVSAWQDNGQLLIDVSDTGMGIEASALEHIFDPFYQAGNDSGNIGTGVGLSLVKQIVDNLEGTVTVESVVNKGTTFHLSLPIHNNCKNSFEKESELLQNTPMLPDAIQMPEDDEDANDNECRILVIEDNPDVATYIGSQLVGKYVVSYAKDGVEGLNKAKELVPDLIVTDLMMPDLDGLEVCCAIRKNELTNHIPVIIVTAKISAEDRIKGLEAGADAYIAKPFNQDELSVRVDKLLEQRRLLREKYTQAVEEGREQETQITEEDRRFLSRTASAIYILMEGRNLDINVLAEKMCLSPRQFRRKITALTNDTPATFVLRVRMRRAKTLLDTCPQLSMEEVSERCGFENYSGFYQSFRKIYNVSPSQYKRVGDIS